METSRDIINKLGGVRTVADGLGESWKTVHNWTRPGRKIPARFWLSVDRLAKATSADVSIGQLEHHVASQDEEHGAAA